MEEMKLLFISWLGQEIKIGLGVFENISTGQRQVLISPVKGNNKNKDIEFIKNNGVQISFSTLQICFDIANRNL